MKQDHGRDLTGQEMGEMLDEFCNGGRKEEIAALVDHVTRRAHRTLQQRIMGVFVACMEAWAEGKGGSDPRNEATVALCKKMIAATGDRYDRHLPYI